MCLHIQVPWVCLMLFFVLSKTRCEGLAIFGPIVHPDIISFLEVSFDRSFLDERRILSGNAFHPTKRKLPLTPVFQVVVGFHLFETHFEPFAQKFSLRQCSLNCGPRCLPFTTRWLYCVPIIYSKLVKH